ncbi:hypothetical protein I3F59_000085 [Streptomyces sp. MUM 178J]|nr:hypothetical protein [Streptomyces sp. MUM 178J]WRQ83181.1 hypothetical protein I3F59_000085 [Streptomyces sp. MUM 178J]
MCGTTALSSAPLALAVPTSVGDEITRLKQTGLTAYHGVKPGHLDKVLAGIKRPEGSAGNDNPNWKAFYRAETPNHAAEYTIGEDGMSAGGVVEVTLPEDVTVATVNMVKGKDETAEKFEGRRLKRIKEEFGVNTDDPLMDSLADRNIVLKLDDGTGRNELILPWKLAERGTARTAYTFKAGPRGVDEAYSLMSAGLNCASGSIRAKRSVSRCADLDWEKVRSRAKETARQVAQDSEHVSGLPERRAEGLTKSEAHAVAERTHAKVSEVSGTRVAATAFGVGTWAYGMAQTFTDQNATTLDKVAVTTAIVPGVGNALGIADGIEHHDPEAVAVNAVALAALVAAQAVPVVGELVDTVLLTEQIVETFVNIFQRATAAPPPPPSLDPGALPILAVPKPALECSFWWRTMDITWDTSVKVPGKTQVVVKERGGKEYTYPAADGKSPSWGINKEIGGSRTFDVFYRVTTDQGKTLVSNMRAVVKQQMEQFGTYCNTYVSQEDW